MTLIIVFIMMLIVAVITGLNSNIMGIIAYILGLFLGSCISFLVLQG